MGLSRVVVLGLEGVPLRVLHEWMAAGAMPHLAALVDRGSLCPLESVLPADSTAAWTSFATGLDPGGHNRYGFVDRRPESWEIYVPTARHRTGEAVWERLSRLGKRVCVMNVPGTHPPKAVNGVLVSGYLAPDVSELSVDPDVVEQLETLEYRIGVSGRHAAGDVGALVEDVLAVLDARERAALHFLRQERWDFFMAHVIAVDRMQHLLWGPCERGDPEVRAALRAVYARLDQLIGAVVAEIGDDAELMLLSDHGFATIEHEVELNRWLEDEGYLVLTEERAPARFLKNIDVAATRAYSLAPGRIYVNLAGRESGGIVSPGDDYERLRREIAEKLLALTDPESGRRVIDSVLQREQLYEGEAFHRAADLVAHPVDGYELRGTIVCDQTWKRTPLTGMHTHGGAFLYVRGNEDRGDEDSADRERADERVTILDAHTRVLELLGLA